MPDPQTPEPLRPESNVAVSKPAADRKVGMTLDELGSFVTRAVRAETPGDSPIYADISMGGRIRVIHARPEKRKGQL